MAKKRKVETKATSEAEESASGSQEEPISQDSENADEVAPAEAEVGAEDAAGEEGEGEDGSEEEDNAEDVRKLLEPFGKDQLMDLLRDVAVQHTDVLDRINKIADVDPAHRKVFVHGLGWDTTAETLTNFFKKYGEIEDSNAVMDKATGKSKGYGFILFKHRKGAQKALKQPQKKIGSRMTACQLASAGPVPPTPPVSEYTQRKIYVSNVSADIDPQRLLQYFSKYGEIEEGPLGLDKQTGKPKGFTLFVYKTVEGAKKALEEPHKNFEGYALHCQKAIDGPKPGKPHYHHPGANQHGFHRNANVGGGFLRGAGSAPVGGGHLMASGGLGFNQAAAPATAPASLNPALGQALTALLASQGAGLGLTNVLASLNPALNANFASVVNQTVPNALLPNAAHGVGGFAGQPGVGANMYANQALSYQNVAQPSGVRPQQPGGAMGGMPPYIGH